MALPAGCHALRMSYIEWLVKKGSIELQTIKGVPGVMIVSKSHRKVGVAKAQKGKKRLWQRIDMHLGAGTILATRWLVITNDKSLFFWQEIERLHGVPSVWIKSGNIHLLLCAMHVEDFFHFKRMQEHILLSANEEYPREYALIASALKDLESLSRTLFNSELIDKSLQNQIAIALGQIESLFEWCKNAYKQEVVQNAHKLSEQIARIKNLARFDENIRKMIEAIKIREDEIRVISPFIVARADAASQLERKFKKELKSHLTFINNLLCNFGRSSDARTLNRQIQSILCRATMIDDVFLCKPFRFRARLASACLRRVASNWQNPKYDKVVRDLRTARTLLTNLQSMLI